MVTDGEDNASRESLEQAVAPAGGERPDGLHHRLAAGRALQACQARASRNGRRHRRRGFFPKDLSEVHAITSQIAHDIRNQYTIGYKPSTPQSAGGFRTVKVVAQSRGYKKLQVRTRSGYYAGQQSPSTNTQRTGQ